MNILLCGCNGRMGKAVAACAARDGDFTVVAGVDIAPGDADFPVYSHPEQVQETVDAVVDFSAPASVETSLSYAVAHKIPAVIATTGLDERQIAAVDAAAQFIPVLYSGNLSFGVAVLTALSRKAAALLGDGWDVEILEMHHNQKKDAPSGTAKLLADAVQAGRQKPLSPVYDRHATNEKRSPSEIGIVSLRGGTVVGEHQVIFAGHDETLTLTHRAQSREIFAVGALQALRFLAGKPAGRYGIDDLL